ncbi:retinol dehydrogenase 12-like, partial [Agrilus planipennis]|uniref:Retinol dehydrogenase 12-like n=1 Tax=Agrilus planipennis TaxID=224129 RepID=A0A7F5RCR3_AGRPL
TAACCNALLTGAALYGIYRYFYGGICRCTTRLDGLVIIITGPTSGIGKALSFLLVERGASLVLACRDLEKGNQLKNKLKKYNSNNAKIFVKQLNLQSFSSIIKFAEDINSTFNEIYALVNNAGVFFHEQKLTEDGFDITFQVNYLGPFVLTHHLLKTLKKSDHARVVNVASEAHRTVNVYDLKAITKCQTDFRTHYKAYGVSKLALVLFSRQLAKKLKNTNILVNAVNPGNVETAIYRYFPPLCNPFLYALQWPVRTIVVKRPHQGAQSLLHSLLTSNRSTGQYISDCKLALPSSIALNDSLAEEYYDLTMQLLSDIFTTESDC